MSKYITKRFSMFLSKKKRERRDKLRRQIWGVESSANDGTAALKSGKSVEEARRKSVKSGAIRGALVGGVATGLTAGYRGGFTKNPVRSAISTLVLGPSIGAAAGGYMAKREFDRRHVYNNEE